MIYLKNHSLIKLITSNKSTSEIDKSARDIKNSLISYISIWYTLVQQNIVSTKDVAINLKGHLTIEHLILEPLLQQYIQNANAVHHYDAIDCENLFTKCANINVKNGEDND